MLCKEAHALRASRSSSASSSKGPVSPTLQKAPVRCGRATVADLQVPVNRRAVPWTVQAGGWLTAAVAAGVLSSCACPDAAAAAAVMPLPQPLMYGNAAVLKDLRTLRQQEKLFGSEAPGAALVTRFKQVSSQLQRFETLVRIGQWDSARMQLREGAFKQLRMDLAYGQEAFQVVTPQMVRSVVEGVEALDGALKRQQPLEDIRPIVASLQQQLDALAAAVEPLREAS